MTFRSILRRSRKSCPHSDFSSVLPNFQLSTDDSQPPLVSPSLLSSLESALTDNHRVLPSFTRKRPAPSPSDATLLSILVSADSKQLTGDLSPLESALAKTGGWRGLFTHISRRWTFRHADIRPTSESHCGRTPLVPQSAKVREFFTIPGNKSALPGV